MKIVILDGYTENPGDLSWEAFEALGEVTVYDRTPKEMIVERIGDAQAVITNKTPMTRQTLDNCPSIRYIGVLATGYNVVDTGAAKEKGIPVTNIPTYGTTAVARWCLPFCWKCATMWAPIPRRLKMERGAGTRIGVFGIILL